MNIILVLIGTLFSFLNFGIVWAGVNQWLQSVIAVCFFLVSYYVTKTKKGQSLYLMLGAAPIYALLVQFRDKNDSHLLGIAIIASGAIAVVLGRWLGITSSKS